MSHSSGGRTPDQDAATGLEELPEYWRQLAATLDRYGAEDLATALKRCGDDLEAALRNGDMRLANLTEAGRVCGYSADHLGRLIRQKKLTNYGRPGAPLVRVGDLPKKASALPLVSHTPHLVGATCRELARAVVSAERRQ